MGKSKFYTWDDKENSFASNSFSYYTSVNQRISWKQHVTDFGNVFKGFIGSNYLTIAFAFKQSGLVPGRPSAEGKKGGGRCCSETHHNGACLNSTSSKLGLIGLAIVAGLTDLCCHVIVKCKYAALRKIINQAKTKAKLEGTELDQDEERALRQRITKSLQYGDIGKIALGTPGRVVVNCFIMLTQFGFCVQYFVFIGNTIVTIFACPHYPPFHLSNATHVNNSFAPIMLGQHNMANQIEDKINVNALPSLNHLQPVLDTYDSFDANNETDFYLPEESNTTTTTANPNADPWAKIMKASVTCLPPLSVFILSPLPVFLAFSLIRNIRQLGIVSILADVSIFGGIACMLAYLSATFSLTSYSMVNWKTFPIFVGAVTGAYEGIGTVIPIESSMEGNRKNFPIFLHIAVLGLSSLLAILGVLGYLHYGDDVQQMLNLNIASSTSTMMVISKFVDVTLCIGIILTFPLQIFPVIELMETYLFAEGQLLGPRKSHSESQSSSSSNEEVLEADGNSTLINQPADMPDLGVTIAVEIPRSVATWKRNTLRVFIVLLCCGVGILCRNIYAYVGAFIGAVGSTTLAFILPCLFQIVLCRNELHVGYIVRNCCIIMFGLSAGVISVYSVVAQLLSGSD